jgi:phosphoribosylformylglycinamidine synthase
MKVRVHIMPKSDLLDPQGEAINTALLNLGFSEVLNVRQGKVIDLEMAESDSDLAIRQVDQMCKKLLANSLIENYNLDLI